MSDETLTDEALDELRAKAREASIVSASASGTQEAPHPALLAFQRAVTPDVVLTLLDELVQLREEERKRRNNFDWLAKARREGTAVSLGRSGWALPPRFKGEPEK